jgi:hypothetical protein
LNKEKTLIKKRYSVDGLTVSGKKSQHTSSVIADCFKTEIYWIERLQGKWVPPMIDIDESKQEIITEYYGPDLLTNYQAGTLLKDIPDIIEQVIEMFKFFKEHNVYKFNNALSNMTVNNKQLVAFDFKWARERPEGKEHELFSYTEWMSKIDDKLPEMLEKLA